MPQNIVFTALPSIDHKSGKHVVSVFVSFQLLTSSDTATLAAFPDVKDWLNKLAKGSFTILVNDSKELKGTLVKSKFDTGKYGLLFTDSIRVMKNYQQEDLTKFPIKSYPVKHITGFIEKVYKEVGNAKSDEVPNEIFYTDQWKGLNDISEYNIKDVPSAPGRIKYTEQDLVVPKHTVRRIRGMLAQNRVMPFSNTPQPTMDFGQLKNFHSSSNINTSKPEPIPKPDFEYHDILSVLTGYPILQRKFGLVLDIEVLAGDVKDLGSAGTVRVVPQGLEFLQKTTICCPATSYIKTSTGFFAQSSPTGSIIDKGMLKINTADFSVVTYDTDGAALKLCNQIDNLVQLKAKHISMLSQAGKPISFAGQQEYENFSQRSEGLPVLRSSGIGIVRNGLANDLYKKLVRSNKLNDALLKTPSPSPKYTGKDITYLLPTELLYADDLVQGYRMDVSDFANPSKGWFSLHRRFDTYRYSKPGSPIREPIGVSEEDEGFIQLGASQEKQGDKAIAVGEVMARWEGWSLSVRRPGIAINNPGEGKDVNDNEAEKAKYVLPGSIPFRLEVESKIVKGSLPKLRFGKEYNIKVRIVDLAGNSLPFDKVPENHPVAIVSRIKYRRYEPTPAPVLVQANEIKDGESVERMVIRSNKDKTTQDYESSAGDKLKFSPVATRHVLAPRNTQHIAELHDMFDGIAQGKKTQQDSDYLFIDQKDPKEFINPDHEGYKKIGRAVIGAGDKNIPLSYLADPMAAGVVFFLAAESDFSFGMSKLEPKFCSFYHDEEIKEASMDKPFAKAAWRDPKSFRIELAEGKKRPEWNVAERKFIVYLDKGVTAILNFASYWRPEDVKNISGIYTMVVDSGNTDTQRNTRQSKHWMISPWRQLTLVHAIQQPLTKPEIKELKAARVYNDTTANLNSRIAVHGKSTDKINLEAIWQDYLDDYADIAPKVTLGTAVVSSINVDYFNQAVVNGTVFPPPAGANERKEEAIVHQFNDTKHRWVFYRPVATTRYREYFTNLVNKHAAAKTAFPLTAEGDVFKDGSTDKFNALNNGKVNILSTARPAAPLVEYVLPSFNWAKSVKGQSETHFRSGNIRVYLKRPWFSSGEGERLGVVLTAGNLNPAMSQYFTLWGKDPIFVGGELNGKNVPTPDQATFPLAADYDTKVSMAEVEGTNVAVAAYNVLYDPDRQLYYADVPINSQQAYFPFIKLALCRYQRDSLRTGGTDCCISNIVQTDWIQLVPPRAVMLTTAGTKNKFAVAVGGNSSFMGIGLPTIAHNRFLTSRIRIVVEDAIIPKADEAYVRTKNRIINTVIFEKDYDIENTQIVNGQLQFNTTIEIGAQFQTKPFRVVVEEYELHLADPLRQVIKDQGAFGSTKSSPIKERLVFMDVFEVNGSV